MAGEGAGTGGGSPPKRVTFGLIAAGVLLLLLIAGLAGDEPGTQAEEAAQPRQTVAEQREARQARLDQAAYESARTALEQGRYVEAIRGFRQLEGYRDGAQLLADARSTLAAQRRAERRRRIAAERRLRAREERRRLAVERRRLERIAREQAAAEAEATPPPAPTGGGGCDPNYGGCVPQASDVDCGGGSGDGPEYVYGAVPVTGVDVYDLDSDSDGVACE